MNAKDLEALMPGVDFGAPISDLPDLPDFTEELRAEIEQSVTLYGKRVLRLDNEAWGALYLILAAHERDVVEAEAIDAQLPATLPYKSRQALDRVARDLEKTRADLNGAMRAVGVSRRLEKVGGLVSLTTFLDNAIAVIDSARSIDERPTLTFPDADVGRLELLLSGWWQQRTGTPPSVIKGESAYQAFLGLCFRVLSKPPGHSYDVLSKHRARYEQYEDTWRAVIGRLQLLKRS